MPKFDVGDMIRNVEPYPGEPPYMVCEVSTATQEYVCFTGPGKYSGMEWDLMTTHTIPFESDEYMEHVEHDRVAFSEVWNDD